METIKSYAKLIAGVVVMLVIAAAGAYGYHAGYSTAETAGQLALSQYQSREVAGVAEAASAAFADYANQVTHAKGVESKVLAIQDRHDNQATINKGKIDAVAQPHRTIPASQSDHVVYQCVFSRDFVRVWNDAAGIGAGDRALQGRTDASSADPASAADGAADSGVSQADILDWFIDYANRARNVESGFRGLIHALPSEQ
ncbi:MULTISPECIES: hypothetical protein [Burkholderia]|uniref:hypothetical protein n=1 Tax=Burkholderia TaxID=32008 RepID=UPI000F5FBE95|nr:MULTISPECIES: hypothetical protein [Burkholderia]RQZ74814.1 hypothetical protein DF052_06930 [Burkholderia glumae]